MSTSRSIHHESILTVSELNNQLQCLIEWELFAIHLEGISQSDVDLIRRDHPAHVAAQRTALYNLWLRRCPTASWDHVIAALDKARENALAQQIRDYLGNTTSKQPVPVRAKESSATTLEAKVDEDTVKTLANLKDTFTNLASDVKEELKQRIESDQIPLGKMILWAQEEENTYKFDQLDDVKDINSFFRVLLPHYHFLDCHLLVMLSKRFLYPSEVLSGLCKHQEHLKSLKQNTKIKELKQVLEPFITSHPCDTPVIVKAQNAWDENELRAVEALLQKLFRLDHAKMLKLFRVIPGSVCIVYLVPHHIVASMIRYSVYKNELMKLSGIISLQFGEICKLRVSKESNQYTFEIGLLEAVQTRNHEAATFLLENIHVNVNGDSPSDNEATGNTSDNDSEETDDELIVPSIQAFATGYSETIIMRPKKLPKDADLTSVDFNANSFIKFIDSGATPLMMACCNDDTNMVELLLRHNANTNMQTRTVRWTALMYATILGSTKTVELLLKHNAKVDTKKNLGFTALMYGCFVGNAKTVKELLRNGADHETKSDNGSTALYIASDQGYLEIVEILLKAKANPNTRRDDGATPLFMASHIGHLNIVQRLLQAKADPCISRHDSGTPLYFASQKGHVEVVERLLLARVDPNTLAYGATSLYIASQNGHKEVVKRLLQAKADPNIAADDGATPLYIASQQGHVEIVEILLQAKADPDIPPEEGTTPLFIASQNGHVEVVERLLQAKADPELPRKNGSTPLYMASLLGNLAVVEKLLQGNAKPGTLVDGETALSIAQKKGHSDIVKLLLRASEKY